MYNYMYKAVSAYTFSVYDSIKTTVCNLEVWIIYS